MQSATTQEGIELDFLKTSRGAEALLIASGNVAGSRLSFSLGFRAFKDNDVSGHGC